MPGEDNVVADGLSHFLVDPNTPSAAVLSITPDADLIRRIKSGYVKEPFCLRRMENLQANLGYRNEDLLFLGERLTIS